MVRSNSWNKIWSLKSIRWSLIEKSKWGRSGFDPWVGQIPWRRERLPTPVLLPEEFHGQGGPWWLQSMGSQRVDTTKSGHNWASNMYPCTLIFFSYLILIWYLLLFKLGWSILSLLCWSQQCRPELQQTHLIALFFMASDFLLQEGDIPPHLGNRHIVRHHLIKMSWVCPWPVNFQSIPKSKTNCFWIICSTTARWEQGDHKS